ncbi:VCBS repeat-containing protein [Streptomyces sp. NBC_00291]|uniref:FG-GAP repeat domain-containing protein n=1 Tax=Streptomyces sp. NBC_00291 TaxID=2975704 RepID=UPI00225BBA81|nr:VCBS repeat-containing protein [Streptomyces sp. NBC_00291]MCX5152735.1 VCBS repeat-containing protein [Streptomyces sp. NBC_00291]
MAHARSTRLRILAATTTVLAVTLGAGALSAPAHAATTPVGAAKTTKAPAAKTAADVIGFPKNSKLLDAGLTGFLTREEGTFDKRWTRYSNGASQGYGSTTVLRSSKTADYLVFPMHYQVTLRNLSTMSVLDVPVGSAGNGATYAGSAADAVFTTSSDGTVLRKHTHPTEGNGTVTVTGLPAGASAIAVTPGTPEDALVTFTVGTTAKWGLLDLATGVVDEIQDRTPGSAGGDVAVSRTHLAWTEGDSTDKPAVFLKERATGTVREIPVEDAWSNDLRIGLVGSRLVYGEAGGLSNGDTNPLYALTAYDPATGTKVKLLDHLTSSAAAPDGLYVRGGTVDRGEGLYKIVPGADGTPTVTLVASTGEPTKVVITENRVPAVVDLDQNGGEIHLGWGLSRSTVEADLTLRHVRTGLTRELSIRHPNTPDATFRWDGTIGPDHASAHNGEYTWELKVRPLNGIGPATSASGTFAVTRKTAPHDFDDNGSTDVLSRDSSGRLWRSDTTFFKEFGQLTAQPRQSLGAGWDAFDRIEATGDLDGSAFGDLVARDKTGVLWLYPGTGRGGFANRVKVGGGWQIYDKIAGGSDLNGDGRADLLATDTAGALWLYKGTGSATTPFAARTKLGEGWGIYNELTAVGDIADTPAGDLLARDKAGVLWLYAGKGDGTFAPRTKLGAGWNEYGSLVGIGDGDRDGRPDLLASGTAAQYLYGGTGNLNAPLRGRQLASLPYVNDPGNLIA